MLRRDGRNGTHHLSLSVRQEDGFINVCTCGIKSVYLPQCFYRVVGITVVVFYRITYRSYTGDLES